MSNFFEDPLGNLRQVKGAPLSILVALRFAHQPVQAKWLASVTGYSPNIITSSLVLLKEMQEVDCDASRSSWKLNDGVRQLPLTPQLDQPDRINRDPAPPPPSSSLIGREPLIIDESERKKEEEAIPDRVNRDPELVVIKDLLYDRGIGEPMLSKITAMEHVTVKYVLAHTTRAMLDGDPINILVHRLRANDKQPKTNDQDHVLGCDCCERCKHSERTRYYTG